MKSAKSKVLHPVGGRAMLEWSVAAAREAGCERVLVVHGISGEDVAERARALGCETALQDPPLGTGHAVNAAQSAFLGYAGDLVVLYADTPLVSAKAIGRAFDALKEHAIAVLGFHAADPGAYGRLILGEGVQLRAIVEASDATPAERAVSLCNSGVMAVRSPQVWPWLDGLTNDNAKGEFYLTDLVGKASAAGETACVVEGDEREFAGVNSRAQLADAEAVFQAGARLAAMEAGVTLIDPPSVFFSYDTDLAPDVTVEPFVVFGPSVSVEAGARINAHSHLVGARVGAGAEVGPFARLRPGADIGPRAKVGNFVEIKKTTLGAGAKVSHLSYVGDAEVGAGANIGAGVITCNYDGYAKHQTIIGEGAFIGSNTALVAPVRIGARAYTGSGSVITKDVADDALAVARGRQRDVPGWSISFRQRHGDAE